MSRLLDDVRDQASRLGEIEARGNAEEVAAAECELLRRLGAAMKVEETSFDPVHGFARIVGATEAHGEVRLMADGEWILDAPEEKLLACWSRRTRPALHELLEAVQKTFSSAKIGNLVDDVRAQLPRASSAGG